MKKVVLAFSGGLDTSYCAVYLSKVKKMEVYSALVNTGGFDTEELKQVHSKAETLGLKEHVNLEVTEEFYTRCVKYLVFGNALRNHTYPLSVSAERVFQAMAIADYANKIGADAIAHGSTGAGNDQVRFDLVFEILCPEKEIITPIRDQQLSREEEVRFLEEHGVSQAWNKAKYSINKGLWGTSVGGAETLTSNKGLPEEAWPTQVTKSGEESVELEFDKGELTGINGEKFSPVEAIMRLAELAAPFGIGRDIHVGDTIIGIKGRVGFEAAAPLIIIKSHQLLEKHVLSKWQQYWKDQMGTWYGMQVHEGQFLEPVLRDIESFLSNSQQRVTGKVIVKLFPYRFELLGIESQFDLMSSEFGSYGEMNIGWTGEDVKAFTKVLSNAGKIQHKIQGDD